MPRRFLLTLMILLSLVTLLAIRVPIRKFGGNLVELGNKLVTPPSDISANCTPNFNFPKKTVESDAALPEKVKDSFKNTIAITSCFILNNPNSLYPFSSNEPIESGGTGFIVDKVFISARHIFLIPINSLNLRGFPYNLNERGLPESRYYKYSFYGTANIDNKAVYFPLELAGMGKLYTFQDFAAFKPHDLPPTIKSLELEDNAYLDETVYASGRVPVYLLPDELGQLRKKVLLDFVQYNFQGSIKAILTDMGANTDGGTEKIYRIRGNLEPGFSGGPVFNKEGRVIALTISRTSNFVYAISATDIKKFIVKLKASKAI